MIMHCGFYAECMYPTSCLCKCDCCVGNQVKLNVDDYLIFIGYEEDRVFLKRPSFPVNMRLFRSSEPYRDIVMSCCHYIADLAMQTMDGYKKPHGMSGANAAIPFNIIGVVKNRGKEDEFCEIWINPTVVAQSESTETSTSNCGSLRLTKDIKIRRYTWVEVEYYTTDGEKKRIRSRNKTVQHEIDHNNGILITDRLEGGAVF